MVFKATEQHRGVPKGTRLDGNIVITENFTIEINKIDFENEVY